MLSTRRVKFCCADSYYGDDASKTTIRRYKSYVNQVSQPVANLKSVAVAANLDADNQEAIARYVDNAIFSCVTWRGDLQGTVEWKIDVLREIGAFERAQVTHIAPCAEVLLRVSGNAKVRAMLALFDQVEAIGIQLVCVSSDYLRWVYNRLAANPDIKLLTLDAHTAFESRKGLAL